MDSTQDSDLAHFFGDLSQIGKLSGIKQPLGKFKRTKSIFSKAPSTKKEFFHLNDNDVHNL